jgi:hypothetical protein
MSSDKRRDPRFEANKRLWCEGQADFGEAKNMSRSGMFVVAEEPLAVGEQIKVSFENDEGTVELNMEVMWSGKKSDGGQAGMGLRIVGFDKGEDVYDKFVREQLQEQGLADPDADTEPQKK